MNDDAQMELTLPDVPLKFVRTSETSRLAAFESLPRHGTQRWRILKALAANARTPGAVGLTRDAISAVTGFSPNTVRPRIVELIQGSWVKETELRGKSDLGREAAMLVLTERGLTEFAAP